MPTVVTHAFLGAAAYRFAAGPDARGKAGPLLAATLCALPDVDAFWTRATGYAHPLGHRGLTHSLAFAAVLGAAVALASRKAIRWPHGTAALAALLIGIVASHGVLDAATDGGLGIGFLLPASEERHFLPVRPIPVAPLGVYLANLRTWYVIGIEALLFWPLALLLFTGRSALPRWARGLQVAALAGSAVVWGMRLAE